MTQSTATPTRRMKLGIMPRREYRTRALAIARGELQPAADEPKVWFESLQSMAQVLSAENQQLLRLIIERRPGSLTELERISGRKKPNLSRTLKTLARFGVVELHKEKGRLVPTVKYTDFEVQFGLGSPGA